MSRSAHPAGPRHGDLLSTGPLGLPPADLNALDPKVWPASARRLDGEISVGGIGVRDLVARYGTPLYVYDEADVRRRAREWATAFADSDVYYASKAFLCIGLAQWVAEEGLGLDVCTGGELTVALAAGLDPRYLVFHGNNKSEGELAQAVGSGVHTIVVDSFAEIERLCRVAKAAKVTQRVLIRVTVGVEAHTHEFIATAHEDQKFGFSLATGAALEAVDEVISRKELTFGGLHSHIGSQIFDTSGFEVAAARVVGLMAEIRDKHSVIVEEIDLGGGMGIAYLASDTPMSTTEFAERLRQIVVHECAAREIVVPRISVEPGRAIVGNPGITVYRVGTVKDIDLGGGEYRRYISVDGGMSDNIRTALYDASFSAALASRDSSAAPVLSRVVGRHCESGDIVVRDVYLPSDVSRGDLLAVAGTGAYCRSMSSNYNYLGRPPVVGVREGRGTLLVRRETEDDLLRLDTMWSSSDG